MSLITLGQLMFVVSFALSNDAGRGGARAFELTILHTNDVHARFEAFTERGGICRAETAASSSTSAGSGGKNGGAGVRHCFGGVARRATMVKNLRRRYENVLLLDAGDQYQGTLWFSVHKGSAASYFMNLLKYDAMVGIKIKY